MQASINAIFTHKRALQLRDTYPLYLAVRDIYNPVVTVIRTEAAQFDFEVKTVTDEALKNAADFLADLIGEQYNLLKIEIFYNNTRLLSR